MGKISIIYWSGTGNTLKMAVALAEGAKVEGCEVNTISVEKATKEDVLNTDVIAFGCPSMGCEVLEEDEMEPFIGAIENENLEGKHIALFGSYDWGDGQWMKEWEERMRKTGAKLIEEGLIVQNTPDEEGLERCRQLGRKMASI